MSFQQLSCHAGAKAFSQLLSPINSLFAAALLSKILILSNRQTPLAAASTGFLDEFHRHRDC
jgi:hypothetical protein